MLKGTAMMICNKFDIKLIISNAAKTLRFVWWALLVSQDCQPLKMGKKIIPYIDRLNSEGEETSGSPKTAYTVLCRFSSEQAH